MDNGTEGGTSGEELYRRYLSGDEEAFDAIVALFGDDLFLFIDGMVGDHHESMHLMIEAFARLAAGGAGYEGRASIKTYLFAIGKNLSYRHVKKRGRERHVAFEEAIRPLAQDTEEPHEAFEREENRRLIRRALLELKDEYRMVLELLYFQDLSYREAGLAMKKSEAQIGSLAHRAKLALKNVLESGGYFQT